MTNFHTPSRRMAATIALVLLALFAIVLLTPIARPDIKFDPALVQTLLTLLVVGVSYYLGTSNSSNAKDDTINAQAKAAAPTPPAPLGSGNPTGKPDDPVAVTPVPSTA